MQNLIQNTFHKDPDDVTIADMKAVGQKLKEMDVDCTSWTIGQSVSFTLMRIISTWLTPCSVPQNDSSRGWQVQGRGAS